MYYLTKKHCRRCKIIGLNYKSFGEFFMFLLPFAESPWLFTFNASILWTPNIYKRFPFFWFFCSNYIDEAKCIYGALWYGQIFSWTCLICLNLLYYRNYRSHSHFPLRFVFKNIIYGEFPRFSCSFYTPQRNPNNHWDHNIIN